MKRYTVCVDFDGVLHDFDGRWKGHSSIEGDPVPGAVDWLTELVEDFDVVILTTRGATVLGQEACKRWLEKHGVDEDVVRELVVTDEKPPALVYIDDRAVRFEGLFPTVQFIHGARPWNRGGKKAVKQRTARDSADEIERMLGRGIEWINADGCLIGYVDGDRISIDTYGQWHREKATP